MVPGAYNNNMQLVQTEDHIMILNEMIHRARIIRLDSEHHTRQIKWDGDSIAHWEGDTLVVHTQDFYPRQCQQAVRLINAHDESSSRSILPACKFVAEFVVELYPVRGHDNEERLFFSKALPCEIAVQPLREIPSRGEVHRRTCRWVGAGRQVCGVAAD